MTTARTAYQLSAPTIPHALYMLGDGQDIFQRSSASGSVSYRQFYTQRTVHFYEILYGRAQLTTLW